MQPVLQQVYVKYGMPARCLISFRCSVRRVAPSHSNLVRRAAGPIDLCRAAGYSFDEDSYEVRSLPLPSHRTQNSQRCYACATMPTFPAQLRAPSPVQLSLPVSCIHHLNFAQVRRINAEFRVIECHTPCVCPVGATV